MFPVKWLCGSKRAEINRKSHGRSCIHIHTEKNRERERTVAGAHGALPLCLFRFTGSEQDIPAHSRCHGHIPLLCLAPPPLLQSFRIIRAITMSECNETPDRSLICTCPRMYAVCSAVPRAVCAVRALKEREDTETVTKRGRRIPDQTSAFIHNSRGEVVSVRLPLLGSLHFLFLSGIFPTKRQKKKKWQERLCFEVVSPGEKLYCFDTGIQSEMMMTTRTTYIRGWYNSDEKRAAFVCLRSPSPGSPRERGSGYKLWLSYYLRYGVFGIIHYSCHVIQPPPSFSDYMAQYFFLSLFYRVIVT